MPAGNDASRAASELADKFGTGAGNADEMIQASRAPYQGDLGKAQLLEVEDVEVDLDVLSKTVGEKSVLSAAVRGPYIIFVYEDKSGRAQKGCIELSDLEKPKPKAKPKAESKAKSE